MRQTCYVTPCAQSHFTKDGTLGGITLFCSACDGSRIADMSAIRHRLNTFWEQRSTQLAVQATVSTREKARYIQFVRAGQRLPAPNHITQRKPLASQAILLQANDWTFLYDLERQLQFPIEAAVTSLRPDVVLFSRSSKTIVLLELTVPLEDNVHLAHDRKTTKYSALVTACEENGFKTHMFALEVGCLGYCPHSFLHCFEALGLPKSAARQIRSQASKTALRSSYYRKRGSASYIVREVHSVRERDTERERKTEVTSPLWR